MIFLRLSPSPPLPPPLCKRWGLPPPYPNGKRVAGREGLKCLSHLFDCIVPPLFLSRDGMGLFCRVNGGGRARETGRRRGQIAKTFQERRRRRRFPFHPRHPQKLGREEKGKWSLCLFLLLLTASVFCAFAIVSFSFPLLPEKYDLSLSPRRE